MKKYAALYVHSKSNYKLYDDFDCFDEARDTRNFKGNMPVVAHPPCRLFSRLRAFSKADIDEKKLAYTALAVVRKNGGILEHPCSSLFWKEANIVTPGQRDKYGGFTISINQHWFGYYTEKKTRLYIVGICPNQMPKFPLSFNAVTRKFGNLSRKQRSETTAQLIDWFILILEIISNNKEKSTIIR